MGAAKRRALAEAQIKFAPQERVLVGALQTARSGALSQIRSARGTSTALQAAIRRARKPLAKGYADAAATTSAARGDLLGHLASLGPAAAPFSAAVAREQAGNTSRAAQERADALRGLSLMGVQAAQGGVSAELNARTQLQQQRAQIGQQLQGIEADKGAFTVAQLEEIKAADRAFKETQRGHDLTYKASTRNSRRSAATQRRGQNLSHADKQAAIAQRKAAAQAKANKPRKNPVTRQQSGRALDQIAIARQAIKTYGAHHPSSTVRQWLLSGQTLQSVGKDPATGKPKTFTQKVPQIKGSGPITAKDIINSAYDLEVRGTLSRPNRRALRGVHVPAAWKPHAPRVLPDVAAAERSGHAR